jgi:hypothetical protein
MSTKTLSISIVRKIKNGKQIRILECENLDTLLLFVRSHYDKQGKWICQENAHLKGIIRKRYRMVLKHK